jgi:predicted RecB family nuclease
MTSKINKDALESYLNCKFKGHLKLAGEKGTKCDYEILLNDLRDKVRLTATDKILARNPDGRILRNVPLTSSILKQGASVIFDATLDDDHVSLQFDGLQKVEGPSNLGDFHYVPVLFHEGKRIGRIQRLLLDVHGLLLSKVQGRTPAHGVIWHGPDCTSTKVKLNPDPKKFNELLQNLKAICGSAQLPKLVLNDHCSVCEFRQQCQAQALQEENISLLRGMGEKEIRKYNRKGIFTTTQLSCTFRPRKRGKRVTQPGPIHYFALQALALRDKKTYVYGIPTLPTSKTRVYFDVEGIPDRGFAYLLGLIVAGPKGEQRYSFWANHAEEEDLAFRQLITIIGQLDDFCVYHFGSYETSFLKRMRKQTRNKAVIDKILSNSLNVLTVIRSSIYFPTFSNGLKDIGTYLGCTWTAFGASGIQSIVWRTKWEQMNDESVKQTLVQYNLDDCVALQVVTDCIYKIAEIGTSEKAQSSGPGQPVIAWAHDISTQSSRREWGGPAFFFPDFDYINKCAYFDYQREKVFLRTNDRLRKLDALNRKQRGHKPKKKINQRIVIRAAKCPFCKSTEVIRFEDSIHVKAAYDLKITRTGVASRLIECATALHQCQDCTRSFLPTRYKRRDKHFHALKSWAIYQHVVHRVSFQNLESMFEECFDLRICYQELHMIKSLMARRYQATYRGILQKIVSGDLIHADETHANLQKGKGYVWVLTNLEEVIFFFKPSREGEFLHELLKGFKGVLVSDFFSAYESIPCEQQKCLIHLIRDLNQDLKTNPYDEEYKELVREFGQLLRSIISTIDRFGLTKLHLNKHVDEVNRFFKTLAGRSYGSELAESYQSRLTKNQVTLFTFLRHDGVPWNNNNAEHAIRSYANYRNITDGKMTATGLSDYLVLLSIYQTCKYKGVSFLRFLLSQERDIDAFCEAGRKKCPPSRFEVYPPGFPRVYQIKKVTGKNPNRDQRSDENVTGQET